MIARAKTAVGVGTLAALLAAAPAARANPASGAAPRGASASRPAEGGARPPASPSRAADGAARPTAPASPRAEAEARRRFAEGERLFTKGRFADAARAYEAGYALAPRPGFLINIAHCHVRLQDLPRALEQYRAYLAVAPSSPRRAEIERIAADLERRIATERAPVAPLAAPAPAAPPSLAAPAPPAAHPDAYVVTMTIAPTDPAAAPARAALTFTPAPAPLPVDRRWVWPAVGGALAAGVTGAVILWASTRSQHEVRQGTLGTLSRR